MTINPILGEASVELGEEKYRLKGWCVLDPLSEERHQEVCEILSEAQNDKKRWEALIVNLPKDFYKTPFVVLLVKVDDPKHPNGDVYERVGCVRSLYVARMSSAERCALASVSQVQEIPQPLMGWAIEEIRQAELRRERERAEAEERVKAWRAEWPQDEAKKAEEKAALAWRGFWTFPLRPHGEGKDAAYASHHVSSGSGILPEDELQGETDETPGEDEEESLDEKEAGAPYENEEALDEKQDNDSEGLRESPAKVDQKNPNESSSPTMVVEAGPEPVQSSPVIDDDAEDDTDSDCDSASTDSCYMGDEFVDSLAEGYRDQRIFRHLPIVRRALIIR
ncbi:hypothetical protein ACHAPT_001363 [Fusarium lateritium]